MQLAPTGMCPYGLCQFDLFGQRWYTEFVAGNVGFDWILRTVQVCGGWAVLFVCLSRGASYRKHKDLYE